MRRSVSSNGVHESVSCPAMLGTFQVSGVANSGSEVNIEAEKRIVSTSYYYMGYNKELKEK